MRVASLTFDGFDETDSFVALNILNRAPVLARRGRPAAPS